MAKPAAARFQARVLTVVMAVVAIVLVVLVVMQWRERDKLPPPPPSSFQRVTPGQMKPSDRAELERVTQAVSRLIAAPEAQHELAVQNLEQLEVSSLGAIDFKEACVNTYRGMITAQAQLTELQHTTARAKSDAGTIDPALSAEALALKSKLDNLLAVIAASKDRCHNLFTEATVELGIRP